jgi:glycerophosphoryl diester phosphodiesterase
MPSSPSRRAELGDLGRLPFAHRGLHGAGAVENSLAAFEAAISAGHGIELDVQPSLDGEAMVFHDSVLDRLTAERGAVADRTAGQLRAIRFRAGEGTIPTLRETLGFVAGRAPLLIEVKAPERRVGRLCGGVARALEGYAGPYGIMSFNPEVARWFAFHGAPAPRGLVVTENRNSGLRGRAERRLSLLRARPDFVACDVRDLPSAFASAARAAGRPVYTWTVRSAEERARAAAYADQIIYEASGQ